MKLRHCWWFLLPICAGVLTYFMSDGQLRRSWTAYVKGEPAIEYPVQLDLGNREMGEQVIYPFSITNRGGGELIVDNVHSNCSCTGMERQEDGGFVRVEKLRVKAGESAQLVMRVSVRGVPIGTQMVNVVEFRTNDPVHPAGRIEAVVSRVAGGVSAVPSQIVFGTVPVGSKVRQIVEVRDTAASRRVIERVSSTRPNRVMVRLLAEEEGTPGAEPTEQGVPIGRIEVDVVTSTPGEIHAGLQIHLADEVRNPDVVTVVGSVAAAIELSPAALALPRSSASGPVYTLSCLCCSTSGQPLALAIASIPSGLTAEIIPQGEAKRIVRVTMDPKSSTLFSSGGREVIRLRAHVGENETLLDLPVLLQK